ncbi:hypothetical protein BZA77DRAFT_28926 [Pyronema omphalodes]|nr:hypothetical protein BZA77DRAFT_28926 [Pyronema omphalodes]
MADNLVSSLENLSVSSKPSKTTKKPVQEEEEIDDWETAADQLSSSDSETEEDAEAPKQAVKQPAKSVAKVQPESPPPRKKSPPPPPPPQPQRQTVQRDPPKPTPTGQRPPTSNVVARNLILRGISLDVEQRKKLREENAKQRQEKKEAEERRLREEKEREEARKLMWDD